MGMGYLTGMAFAGFLVGLGVAGMTVGAMRAGELYRPVVRITAITALWKQWRAV
jgi:hypothetical protein